MEAVLLVKLIDLLIAGLAAYPITQAKMDKFKAVLQQAIDEKRDLTDAEMSMVFDEATDLHADIQNS
jgi:hypothetical protein